MEAEHQEHQQQENDQEQNWEQNREQSQEQQCGNHQEPNHEQSQHHGQVKQQEENPEQQEENPDQQEENLEQQEENPEQQQEENPEQQQEGNREQQQEGNREQQQQEGSREQQQEGNQEQHEEQQKQEEKHREQNQQQQLLNKLGELPIVSDTCTQVLDIYQRTKGHNILFRTYFGLAECTAKAVADRAVPILYNRLRSPIDKMNDIACTQLDVLEEKYPIITKPTEEVLREGQEQYNKVRPIMDPLVVRPAKLALDVGRTAVSVGSSVASTAMTPAKYAVHMGTAVTSSVIDTGKQAATQVVSTVLARGQQVVEAGLSTPLGQFWLQQFDSALDATEKLVLNHCLSLGDKDEGKEEQEEAVSRRERVSALVKLIHNALYHKAEGDIVRYRMMAGNLMHEIMELTRLYLTLMKDSSEKVWTDHQEVLDSVDGVWNKYVQFIPEAVRPEDPLKRMVVVLGTLTSKLGELFASSTEMMTLVNKHLGQKCQEFIHWCQQSSTVLKERVVQGGQDVERYNEYMAQLTTYIPHIMEMVQFLSDKILDTLDVFGIANRLRRQKIAEITEEKIEEIEMSEL